MTRVTRWLERPVFLALAGAVSLALVSIAASQILLFGAVVGAIWRCRRREVSLRPWPLISWPLLAFAGWTIVAILSSRDVAQSLLETRKFFLYLILLLLPLTAQDESDPVRIYRCVFLDLNTAIQPFDDLHVRTAINLAIRRECSEIGVGRVV